MLDVLPLMVYETNNSESETKYSHLPMPSLSVFRTVSEVVLSSLLRRKLNCKHGK